MKRKIKTIKKEDIIEDFCFVCKDGGTLMFCDHKDCLKAYHPECVGKEDSFVDSDDRWICDRHSCTVCGKTSKFRCFVCPRAVCGHCISLGDIVHVKGSKGFCDHCLKLTLLIEDGKDVDSNGVKVDFNDRETYEFLFMEYWKLIREKEGLMTKHVHYANNMLKRGNRCGSNSNETEGSDEDNFEHFIVSDYEQSEVTEEGHVLVRKGKRSMEKLGTIRKKLKSNGKEFIGWGSKPIIDFLGKIGKDTSKKLSQHDVSSIIIAYCKENKLFHPQKKKKIVCDGNLHAVFGRKSVSLNTIHNHLMGHFAENMEQSSEDEGMSSAEEKNGRSSTGCKRTRKLVLDRKLNEKEPANVTRSSFASIEVANIKLIYLKRSLIEDLCKDLLSFEFEGKLVGSFVRVKSDPNDYSQNNSHQLLLVMGVKIDSTSSSSIEPQNILLQVSSRLGHIPIRSLSDDDFSEEECEELSQRVRNGILKKPTVVDLQEKANSLHVEITKHWIANELLRLQGCIEQANEKGLRRELFELMEKKMLLQKPSEQARLIDELPKVIAETVPVIPDPMSGDLLEDKQVDKVFLDSGDAKKDATVAVVKECLIGVQPMPQEQQHIEGATCEDFALNSNIPTTGFDKEKEQHQDQSIQPKDQACLKTGIPDNSTQNESFNTPQQPKLHLQSKIGSEIQLIELSDDEDDVEVEVKKQINCEDPNFSMWYCASPEGETRGPLPMSLLKQWRDSSPFDLKCKVWKNGQTSQQGILLTDAIRLLFPE